MHFTTETMQVPDSLNGSGAARFRVYVNEAMGFRVIGYEGGWRKDL